MTPAQQTKIELVVEAIEAMTLAQVVATSGACDEHEHHIAVKNVADAREVLAKALGEFLAPNLRIVEKIDTVGEASRTYRKIDAIG